MNRREVKRAPVLRFKGFTNDWEQRKLGDMANILRGASPRPIKDKKWFDTNSRIGWIRISDVTSQNGRVYTLGQHLSKKGQEKTRVVSSQTLLLSIAASVGYPVITYVETGVHDGFVIFDKPKFNLDFMFFKLQSIQNIWNKYGQAGSQVNINSSIVANTSISIPNIEEQKRISILLKKIEENIYLQQRKLRLLKLLKKATQQNIFASTECLPKLKYRNLTGKWQLYRLKDVAKITMGQSPNSKNYTQNPIDHILVQGNADIRNGYVFPRIWTTEITKVANKGDIILCVRAPAGDVGRTKFNVVIGRGVAAIKGNDFIFQQLQFMKSSGYWKKYISGSTFESINSNDIKNAKIFCPSQLEQKNISSLLDDIDTSIQIQQKNILDFKYIKQFLLQNMFI